MVVGIVGLGLMGGSLGLEIRSKRWAKVVGYTNSSEDNKKAMELGLVDEIVDFDEIKKSDIIVLATPVEAIIKIVKKLSKIEATIIDFGSTKRKIIEAVPKDIKKNFVPSHPMAGTEYFGPTAATLGLYKNKVVVICDKENIDKKHLNNALSLFKGLLEIEVVYMSSIEHDKHAAYISHLPHILSFSLANSVLIQEDPISIVALAGGGFKDMSRIAKSSPIMWRDIFKTNKENILTAINDFEKELKKAKEFIRNNNWEGLKEWMRRANILHKIL